MKGGLKTLVRGEDCRMERVGRLLVDTHQSVIASVLCTGTCTCTYPIWGGRLRKGLEGGRWGRYT